MNIPTDIPAEAIPILQEMGYMEADRLSVGALAPRLTLSELHDRFTIEIGSPHAAQPTVLIFGSYT